MVKMISTRIEIAASPATVRQKFLNFSTIPTYSPNGFITSLGPSDPSKPNLAPGDIMSNQIGGMIFTPTILVNSPTEFRWRGTWHELFTGEHSFRFKEVTPADGDAGSGGEKGRTLFVQEESFSGPLALLIGENVVARAIGFREKTRRGFEKFNADFKGWCESDGEEKGK